MYEGILKPNFTLFIKSSDNSSPSFGITVVVILKTLSSNEHVNINCSSSIPNVSNISSLIFLQFSSSSISIGSNVIEEDIVRFGDDYGRL